MTVYRKLFLTIAIIRHHRYFVVISHTPSQQATPEFSSSRHFSIEAAAGASAGSMIEKCSTACLKSPTQPSRKNI
jgi:hypothetical protein